MLLFGQILKYCVWPGIPQENEKQTSCERISQSKDWRKIKQVIEHMQWYQYTGFSPTKIRCIAKKSLVYTACGNESVELAAIYIQSSFIQVRIGAPFKYITEMLKYLRNGILIFTEPQQLSRNDWISKGHNILESFH